MQLRSDEKYMSRCLQLASNGLGSVAPNPMVGAVVVHNQIIIGEGYHQKFGESHAEVNAIDSVADKSLLTNSTLYVNLEPCSHYGKTPPCAEYIIKHKIPNIVIASKDSNPKVSGKGIEMLKEAGCNVIAGVCDKENRELNKRFFTFHEKHRPYIILKWAETTDGFIDAERDESSPKKPTWITGEFSRILVHKWRAEEQAIIVGTNTAMMDNPKLSVRDCEGKSPLRIVLDKDLKLSDNLHLFDKTIPTIVYTSESKASENNLQYSTIDFNGNVIQQIFDDLYKRNIQSLIVEGGQKLLISFINQNLWDEARVFIGHKQFCKGINAPKIVTKAVKVEIIEKDKLFIYYNPALK